MARVTCPEIREVTLNPKERAEARDSYVRSFDKQFEDWSSIARCCLDVKRDEDWRELGYTSWDAWLHAAAPASARYIYLAVDLYQRLVPDIPEEELSEIPLAKAAVLKTMSPGARKHPKIREAAKKRGKTADFIREVQDCRPDQHIELMVEKKIKFTASQWSVVEATYEKYLMVHGGTTLAEFIEWMCAEVSEWTLHVGKEPDEKAAIPVA